MPNTSGAKNCREGTWKLLDYLLSLHCRRDCLHFYGALVIYTLDDYTLGCLPLSHYGNLGHLGMFWDTFVSKGVMKIGAIKL